MKNGLAYCEIALRNRTCKQAFTGKNLLKYNQQVKLSIGINFCNKSLEYFCPNWTPIMWGEETVMTWKFKNIYTHPLNRRASIRHQCRKTTVLSCHRCLINTVVGKLLIFFKACCTIMISPFLRPCRKVMRLRYYRKFTA